MLPPGRILLVEDEFLIRLILEETLAEAGFDVTSAATADDAAGISARTDGFDLLVTDIQTPGERDGLTLARELRTKHPDLAVLFTTGRPSAMETYGRLGPREAFVPKPYGPREILNVVEGLIGTPRERAS